MRPSGLLLAGLAVFLVGVGVKLFGGEEWWTAALAIQIAGAVLLFANAARSRRAAVHRDGTAD